VAENGPDLDRSESGFHEPWMAPAFIDDRLRKRMTNGLPDRLSVAQTERVIRRVETLFAHSFDNVLRQVEHEGRITIGTNGAVPFALASRMQKTVPSSPATQSSPDLHDKLGGTTHPDEASAKIVITSKIGSVAANLDKKSTPKELINFISSDDGWTTAQPGFSDVALLNTYTSTVQTLRTVKIVMGQNNGNITADA